MRAHVRELPSIAPKHIALTRRPAALRAQRDHRTGTAIGQHRAERPCGFVVIQHHTHLRAIERSDRRLHIGVHRHLGQMSAKGLLGAEANPLPPLIGAPQTTLRVGWLATLCLEKVNTRHPQTRGFKQDPLGRVRSRQADQQGNGQRRRCWLGANHLELETAVVLY